MTARNLAPEKALTEGYAAVGHSLPRKDALLKAVGEAQYCADTSLDGMLYMAARYAPAPCGRIRRIDISRAERLSGVHKILLAKDLPHAKLFGIIVPDTPVICGDLFRHVGDVLALVAAESQEVADEAVALIEVDYEEVPGVFSVEEALLPGARPVHEEHPRALDSGRNIFSHFKIRKGNAEEALRGSPVIVENTYRTQMVDPAYIETDMGLAIPHRDGSLTLTGPMQAPFLLRRAVDRMLGLPHSKIRVVSTMTGGGFGTKEESSTEILGRAGLMALLTERPV
ncbi:MAG: xanthine dehydrogenase family protein molybdopterin-binding subunit, partial [Nitrospinota bacterium]